MLSEERINLIQNDDIEAAMPVIRKTTDRAEIEMLETKSKSPNPGSPLQGADEEAEASQPMLLNQSARSFNSTTVN